MNKIDVVICGGGIAGLWLLNTLSDQGFSVVLVEKNTLGGTQTLASQGMIHGGQKYLLQKSKMHAERIAALPKRWEACLTGCGDIDLQQVHVLAQRQVMWPAGGLLARVALFGAAHRIRTRMNKMLQEAYPDALRLNRSFRGPVYELPEKVLDMNSLVSVLSARYAERIMQGAITAVDREGRLQIGTVALEAQMVISVAGIGNEDTLRLLGVTEKCSQRRPLRQIMVRTMPYAIYGHGVELSPSPRVTITSYPAQAGGYVWYLGGSLASRSTTLDDAQAIGLAKSEMRSLFPHIDWSDKEWATYSVDRAEAYDPYGQLPNGPMVQDYGRVLIAWPTKFTLTPLLSDRVLVKLKERGVRPMFPLVVPALPKPPFGQTPWEMVTWTS